MSGYEFMENHPEDFPLDAQGATTPISWRMRQAVGRIINMLPTEISFAKRLSIIEDPQTGKLGVDTYDELKAVSTTTDLSETVGIMRIDQINPEINGYIADLRYVDWVPLRAHDARSNSLSYEDVSTNVQYGLKPLIGAVFLEREAKRLRFVRDSNADAQAVRQLESLGKDLIGFVDDKRRELGAYCLQLTTQTSKRRIPVRQPNESTPRTDG